MGNVYAPHLKLTFGGTLGNPAVEQWSNTVRFSTGEYVPTEQGIEDCMDALDAPLATWIGSAGANISAVAALKTIKLNWILSNGRQRNINTHQREVTHTGGSGVTVHWYQTIALTMRTDKSRGRGHAGRIFPPVVGVNPTGNSPYIALADASAMASAWATCLDALSNAIASNISGVQDQLITTWPVVASPGESDPNAFTTPLLERITGVVVDRVGDVQHRRTQQIPRSEGARAVVAGFGG